MTSAHNILNYPEHLNPFYEDDKYRFWKNGLLRRNSFSNTFKHVRNTLTLRSIRGKKKKVPSPEPSPIVLRKPIVGSSRTACEITEQPELLPRPKIFQRTSLDSVETKRVLSEGTTLNRHTLNDSQLEINNQTENDIPKRRKHKKKRAPLPPGLSSSNLTLSSLHTSDSKWSLDSETTTASMYSNPSENDQTVEDPLHVEAIQNFTQQMEMLTDETRNDIVDTTNNNNNLSTDLNINTEEVDHNKLRISKSENSEEQCDNHILENNNNMQSEKTDAEISSNEETIDMALTVAERVNAFETRIIRSQIHTL